MGAASIQPVRRLVAMTSVDRPSFESAVDGQGSPLCSLHNVSDLKAQATRLVIVIVFQEALPSWLR